MNVITTAALQAALDGKAENDMVYVRTKDSLGYVFEGRVIEVDAGLCDIEATDGEVVWHVKVSSIEYVDVRPLQRFTGYTVRQFVEDASQGMV